MTMNTMTLKVVGEQTIYCDGCENTVKFVLRQLPGIQQVEASYKTQLINLTVDSQMLNLERIRQELDRIGYQVTLLEGNPM